MSGASVCFTANVFSCGELPKLATDYVQQSEILNRIFDRQIVFLVGATRWGTAWVQQCADAHPQICSKGEGHFTDMLFPSVARTMNEYNTESAKIGNRLQVAGLPGTAAGLTFDNVDYLLHSALGLMFARWIGDDQQVRVIMDKTPEHILSLEVLARIVPDMKVIHVIRDGRDEAVSAWDFNLGLSRKEFPQKFPKFSDFATVFADNWSRSVVAARDFRRPNPKRFHQIKCEDLIDDPTQVTKDLFHFLNVEKGQSVIRPCMDIAWDTAPLDFEPGIFKTAFDEDANYIFKMKLMGYE